MCSYFGTNYSFINSTLNNYYVIGSVNSQAQFRGKDDSTEMYRNAVIRRDTF